MALSCAMGQFFEPPPINPDPVWESAGRSQDYQKPDSAKPDFTSASDNDAPVPREQTRVAVLGYHNFSETKPVSEMLLRTSEFRRQMEYIRKQGLHVISMKEFLDWRLGQLRLPARCVLITMDDGWKSVYTDAYPILKEYGYPFTLFLYTKYLTGRGDSMTPAMIREMQAHGATIGSHSTSHLYPKSWKEADAKGPEAGAALVDTEIGDSIKRLSELFGPVNTYCYPGGYITKTMLDRLPGYGYTAAFGIIPGKVTCNEDIWQIHRYMIFGTDDSIFRQAMNFSPARTVSSSSRGASRSDLSPTPPFPVYPQPNSVNQPDISIISAHLSSDLNADPNSVQMRVSGFGRVPAKLDPANSTVQWIPPYRLYLPTITVQLSWKSFDGSARKVEWFFHIDQDVTLQP